ncbi:MAG: RDD family protein [SAR202 cluster bacterium]|nr:RDD family protein [SAR202 cluster bacterium]
MAERDPNEFSGNQFCGNCGAAVVPGATECNQCNGPIQPETDSQVLTGDYIPYCRACGVPVAQVAALNCPKCGVTPLCHEHYYPSTQTCSLCPPFELAPPGEQQSSGHADRPTQSLPQPVASVACPECGARIRLGIQFCANCGAEQEETESNEESRYAGFLLRFGASIIDQLALLIPSAVIFAIIELPIIGVLISVVYFVSFTYRRGQTPGKMALGIQVVDATGNIPTFRRVLLREFVVKSAPSFLLIAGEYSTLLLNIGYVAGSLLLLGYVWVLRDRQNRGWHDHIVGTYVVKRERK